MNDNPIIEDLLLLKSERVKNLYPRKVYQIRKLSDKLDSFAIY